MGAGLVLSADLLHLFAQSLLPECSRLSNSSFHSSRHTAQAARVWAVRPLLSAGPGGVVRVTCPESVSCSNTCAACSRTFSRRARPSPLSRPPSGYLITPA